MDLQGECDDKDSSPERAGGVLTRKIVPRTGVISGSDSQYPGANAVSKYALDLVQCTYRMSHR
jgi:hypothetical protein